MRKRLKSFFLPRSRVFIFYIKDKLKLSVVFMGTSGFACPSLEKLTQSEEVLAVVTQPDKPAGRGKRILPPPVKLLAERKKIPVYQPQNIRESSFIEEIARLKPHLIVVVAFGKILPPQIFNIPQIFSINLHPSLLPRLRGPAPIPWAIIRGEPFTGVTVQRITEKVDEGEILLQEKIRIEPEDTCGTLTEKLSLLGAEVLLKAIQLIKEGKASLTPQDGEVSYASRIRKEEGKINWEKPAREIHNLVRALNPYPGAFTIFTWKDKTHRLKIWQTELWEKEQGTHIPCGTVVDILKNRGFVVKTGKGEILVKQVQMPGRKKINAYEFVKGYHLEKGFLFV